MLHLVDRSVITDVLRQRTSSQEGEMLLSKPLATIEHSIWRNMPEDINIYPHWCKRYSNPGTCLDRPWVFPGILGSQISRHSAHKGNKVSILTHRPSLSPRIYTWYSFLLEVQSPTGPQGAVPQPTAHRLPPPNWYKHIISSIVRKHAVDVSINPRKGVASSVQS
jgi:hypothetical protein